MEITPLSAIPSLVVFAVVFVVFRWAGRSTRDAVLCSAVMVVVLLAISIGLTYVPQ